MATNLPQVLSHLPHKRHAKGPTELDLFYVSANGFPVFRWQFTQKLTDWFIADFCAEELYRYSIGSPMDLLYQNKYRCQVRVEWGQGHLCASAILRPRVTDSLIDGINIPSLHAREDMGKHPFTVIRCP